MSLGDLEKGAEHSATKTKYRRKWGAIPSLAFVIYYLLQMLFPERIASHIPQFIHASLLVLGATSFIWLAWEMRPGQQG